MSDRKPFVRQSVRLSHRRGAHRKRDRSLRFGTVRDERLKKGELKITVIASGFPEALTKKTLFQQDNAIPMADDKKGKIYNSVPLFGGSKEKDTMFAEEKSSSTEQPPIVQTPSKPKDEAEEDDWGNVPAFLRRSKLK